ncbi:MAG: formylglycine-generating enzyme family protein, partial [Lachnospiraceae bacterium]|nr:formylglycine-generating enzyme family protein [Lachnospiraceae bacterium]
MRKLFQFLLAGILIASLTACGNNAQVEESLETADSVQKGEAAGTEGETGEPEPENQQMAEIPEGFILIKGGTFDMGSPESEAWRSEDEVQHSVTVSDFYMDAFEVTQAEYQSIMGNNPSNFTGDNLPVENISWLDAVAYCNARSEAEGLIPVYRVEDSSVSWDRSADGYRLPTEAEWEYACRAGTTTPFNTENSISADESNYWGDYPYLIEDNYFSQGNLETKPG